MNQLCTGVLRALTLSMARSREGHRRQARRAGQAFLAAGVGRVDAPGVDQHRRAAQGGDAIHDHQGAVLAGDGGQRAASDCAPVEVSACTKASILASGIRGKCGLHLGRVDGPAPGILDHHRHAAAALDVLQHAPAEHAVDADDDLVARLHQVHEAGFHAHRAGPGDREGELVFGLEGIAQQGLGLLHHIREGRVEMADGRPRHGIEDALRHVGRPRPHQGAARRLERGDLGRLHGVGLQGTIPTILVGIRPCPEANLQSRPTIDSSIRRKSWKKSR
jgi:hypothetical protein